MLVGLVVIDAVRQPDHLGNAQIIAQRALDLFPTQFRVAPRGEQARLSHKRGALAVHVDRATLADEIPLVIAVVFHQVAELARHAVVALPAGIQAVHRAAPGIEPPVDAATLALAVYHKGRPHVARPGVVRLHHDQTHLRRQLGAGVVILSLRAQHGHFFALADRLNHAEEGLARGVSAVLPGVRPLGPDHQAALVRRELRRHEKAVLHGSSV